ncbi:hypothetical protein D3C78_1645210 [compost metagenome]
MELQVVELIEAVYQPAAQAEADHEVLEILRGDHHHRLAQAVVAECQRALLGQRSPRHARRLGEFGVGIALR